MTISPYVIAGLKHIDGYLKVKDVGFVPNPKQINFDELKKFLNYNYPFVFTSSRRRHIIVHKYSIIGAIYEKYNAFNNMTLVKVGRMFPFGRDHATVIWAKQQVENWKAYPEAYEIELETYYKVRAEVHEFLNQYLN